MAGQHSAIRYPLSAIRYPHYTVDLVGPPQPR